MEVALSGRESALRLHPRHILRPVVWANTSDFPPLS